jgi:hypothetical protein
LNIVGEQLEELKERGDAAERDLVATLDRAYELVELPVEAGEGGLLPYEFEEIDLSARIGLGRVVHDRVLEGLANHVFESITPQKLASLLRLGPERRCVACSEVVDAAFSYLQFPKLRSEAAIREAVAAGAMKGVFGYVSMASADGDGLRVRPELVRIGTATGSDEIDLGEGAFLLERAYAHELAELPEEPAAVIEVESVGGTEPPPSVTTDSGARVAKGRRLTMSFRVGKTELFDAMQVLAALSDESSQVDASVTVNAEANETFDRTWVRNALRERLEEAGIDVEILLGDE